jgi:hypothetical protein
VKRAVLLLVGCVVALTGCGDAHRSALPDCSGDVRLALVAQAVPAASYVPCLATPTAGWRVAAFEVRSGQATFRLLSDRAQGRAVVVALRSTCAAGRATPETSPAAGVRRFLDLRSIRPRYAGTRFDVFPGGCVSYAFDFERGPHIALMADLGVLVGLESRRELRGEVRRRLGGELAP